MKSKDIPKKAAIYARADGFPLAYESGSLTSQIDLNTQYCKKHGYAIVAVFQEIATGAISERVEFLKLRQALEEHAFDVIVVSSFDRLSEDRSIVQAFIIEAEGKGYWVESVTEPEIDIQEELLA
ncbi:MAG TPA: recombinase family protein [Ktedonobacteraceae bacterium]|nr:recombinase family protein [Ktedonobacteraceae bacterium]